MAGKKQKNCNVESKVNNVRHNDCGSWPRRAGAGQDRAAEQLERYANAITCMQPKRTCLKVPLSQLVNKMASPSSKKGC